MIVYLCRHGETILNKQRKWQGGGIDSPLTPEGLKQAKEIAEYLKDKKIEAIFTSPLGRAKNSAVFLCKYFPKTPYFKVAALIERYNGEAEGIPLEQSQVRYGLLGKRMRQKELGVSFPGGKAIEILLEGCNPLLED